MKVAFIFPSGHIYDTPCVPNLISSLSDHIEHIDFYTIHNKYTPDGTILKNNVNIILYPISPKSSKEKVLKLSFLFLPWVGYHLKNKKYDFVIAVGIRGLFVTSILSYLLKIDYIYNSLEVYSYSKRNCSLFKNLFKFLEKKFNNRAKMTIIQDKLRVKLIKRINNLKEEHYFGLFPNAPYTISNTSDNNICEKTLLLSGSLSEPWMNLPKLVRISGSLPSPYRMFLQSRAVESLTADAMKTIETTKSISLNTLPLSVSDYDNLVSDISIGLAWYESEDENMINVGLSSGKVGHYLSKGKPFIINKLPFFGELFEEYECGIMIDDIDEVGDAVSKIESDYESYSKNALLAYNNFFNTEQAAKDIYITMCELSEKS